MPGSSGLRTIESISYVFLRFSLSCTLQSPQPWGPYLCWSACIPVRFDLNQGTFRLAEPRGHTSVRIQWPRWLHARRRLLLDRLFSFQSREACLCLPCHTCKRHSNKLLCGGASYRRLGACAVTDFADALHGTSACNAALHGCLKEAGWRVNAAHSLVPCCRVFAASRPGVVGFPPPSTAFLLPPIADPSLPAASNNLHGTAGNAGCHTGAACSSSLRTGRRGLRARGCHQQCRACTCQSIADACMRGFGKPAQLPTWCR